MYDFLVKVYDFLVKVYDFLVKVSKHPRDNPSPVKDHKRPKQDLSAHPPGFSHFTLTDNGGQGDCAYLAIAMALADANKAKSKTQAVPKDFEPGGRLQAQLRLLASKELANNPSRYFAPGDDRASTVPSQTASAGVWADSVSLSALCQASQVELRIWGFSAKENRWALYILSPYKASKPKNTPVIWLHLKDQHYQWLKPKDSLNPNLVDSWVRHACYKPASLQGAGKSHFDPDALDILGLSVPSTPAKSVCSFPSESGRKASARKPGLESPVVAAQPPVFGASSGSFTPGAHLNCPCGWSALLGNSARSYAISHWRACQGIAPPTLPPGWRRVSASQQHKLGCSETFGDPSQTVRHQIPSLAR